MEEGQGNARELLLQVSNSDLKKSTPNESLVLADGEFAYSKLFFLFNVQLIYFVVGANFYSFPLWLSFIVTKNVSISSSNMSLLGGIMYVTNGLFGLLVMYVKSFRLSASTEFLASFLLGNICSIGSWSILAWVTVTSGQKSLGWIIVCLIMQGCSLATTFILWIEHQMKLLKPAFHAPLIAVICVSVSLGAVVALALKLCMTDDEWMLLQLFTTAAVMLGTWPFLLINYSQFLFVVPPSPPPVNPSTDAKQQTDSQVGAGDTGVQLLLDFMFFRRNFTRVELLNQEISVNSSHFWCFAGAYLGACAVGTTFMANLGPLTEHDPDTEGDRRAQTIVLIWSAVGQTVGRALFPLLNKWIVDWLSGDANTYVDFEGQALSEAKAGDVHQSRVLNRLTLGLSLVVSLVFLVCLVVLLELQNVSFLALSTVLSGGYGMMWCVVCSFPIYFQKRGFTYFVSFFQVVGAIGTLLFTLLISVLKCNNDETFAVLLFVTCATLAVTLLGWFLRYAGEPKRVSRSIAGR